jgi:hypothetical protein
MQLVVPVTDIVRMACVQKPASSSSNRSLPGALTAPGTAAAVVRRAELAPGMAEVTAVVAACSPGCGVGNTRLRILLLRSAL